MTTLLLVPGYWLGAWAFDQVLPHLREAGVQAQTVTLPGVGDGVDPAEVTLSDTVQSLRAAIASCPAPPVLAVHSGAGELASLVTDADPESVAAVIYIDSGPAADGVAPRPDLAEAPVVPAPTLEQLRTEWAWAIGGLSESDLEEFARRAVPQPGAVATTALSLTNPKRLDVPTTLICCLFTGAQVQQMAAGGHEMFGPVAELTDVRFVDLPTGHWPMWSRPEELAAVLAEQVRTRSPRTDGAA